MEEWRDIPGYEGLYQVSNTGRVKSLLRLDAKGRRIKGKMMMLRPSHKGYLKVPLTKGGKQKNKFVHNLVVFTFIGTKPEGMQCNHKNGNKKDNHLDNLEYCTGSYNVLHAYRVLDRPSALTGEKHWNAKLTQDDIVKIRELYKTGNYTHKKLANIFGIKSPAIGQIINRQRWTHVP